MRLTALVLACLAATGIAKKSSDPKDCEVCNKVVGDVMEGLSSKERKDQSVIEKAIADHCSKESLNRQERKLCYLIEPIKRKVSTPITFGMTAEEVRVTLDVRERQLVLIMFNNIFTTVVQK